MIPVKNDVPESFLVENAGLCLLAPLVCPIVQFARLPG